MKNLILLATVIFTMLGCKCTKKKVENTAAVSETTIEKNTTNIPTIYYEATTRGFFMAIKVENGHLYLSKERGFTAYENSKTLLEEDWATIVALTKKVELEKVKDLKWPTEKRHYDGAAHANIIFEKEGVKYPANGFDHGFPPVEIEALVNKIVTIAEKK